jgi:hypothetical protein
MLFKKRHAIKKLSFKKKALSKIFFTFSFKWLKINVLWFIGAFVVALRLELLFPGYNAGFCKKMGTYTVAVGLMSAIEQGVVSV